MVKAARTAMIAITTNISGNVNAFVVGLEVVW
jgi:hypothetical protein